MGAGHALFSGGCALSGVPSRVAWFRLSRLRSRGVFMHNPGAVMRGFGQTMGANRKPPRCARRRRTQGLALAALLVFLPFAFAADSTSLGTFKQWTALSFPDEGGTACMMWSQPEEIRVGIEGRSDAYVFVTHLISPRQFDVVNVDNGYTFGEGTQVKVSVGGHEFVLATIGSAALALDAADNAKMVKAMRAGYRMTVEGIMEGGTRTSDVYSLLGFTAAHEAIDGACGRG